jgi:hypothetical protein
MAVVANSWYMHLHEWIFDVNEVMLVLSWTIEESALTVVLACFASRRQPPQYLGDLSVRAFTNIADILLLS